MNHHQRAVNAIALLVLVAMTVFAGLQGFAWLAAFCGFLTGAQLLVTVFTLAGGES